MDRARLIGVADNSNYQLLAKTTGMTQITDVARVDGSEVPICEHAAAQRRGILDLQKRRIHSVIITLPAVAPLRIAAMPALMSSNGKRALTKGST